MKTRPILFSAAMVRAILSSVKTQTRRIVNPQPQTAQIISDTTASLCYPEMLWRKCPYGEPKDTLWLRETFALENTSEYNGEETLPTDGRPIQKHDGYKIIPRYRATEPDTHLIIKDNVSDEDAMRWTPSIFMPRWASRITLEITGVRVERLQEITTQDIDAEGVDNGVTNRMMGKRHESAQRMAWEALWSKINGDESWASNPWCWIIEFKKV